MFTRTGTTITQAITQTYSSSASYVDYETAVYSSAVYLRGTPDSLTGIQWLFDSSGSSTFDLLRFNTSGGANIFSGNYRILGPQSRTDYLKYNNSTEEWDDVTGTSTIPEAGRPCLRTSNAIGAVNFSQGISGTIDDTALLMNFLNTRSGDGDYIFTSNGTGGLSLFNNAGVDVSAYVAVGSQSGWLHTTSGTDPIYTPSDTGNPDVNPFWTLTTISPTDDGLLREKNEQLANITGVVYEKLGNRHVYTLPSTDLFIQEATASMSIDTEYSKITVTAQVDNPGGASKFDIKGTFNYGVKKSGKADASSSDIYTGGVGLEFTGGFESNSGDWYGSTSDTTAGSHFGLSGTLNINGGDIIGKFVFKPTTSATINNSYPARMIIDSEGQTPGQEPLIRWKNPTVNVTALSIEGGQISYSVANVVVSLDKSAGGIAFWNQSQSNMSNTTPNGNYQTYEDCSVSENSVGFAGYTNGTLTLARHSGSWFQNLESGDDINVNGGELSAQKQNSGTYVMGTKNIETNITSLTDGTDQKGVILIRDTNRFSDLSDPIEEVFDDGVDYFDDDSQFKYRGDFNGSITTWTATGGFAAGVLVASTDLNAVVLWTHQLNKDFNLNRTRATQDAGIWEKDIRSISGTPGVCDFGTHVWSYYNTYVLHPSILTGKGAYTVEEAVSADPGIYLTLTEATSFEAGSDGDAITCTSTDIAINGRVVDLETFYAIEKLRKTTDTSKEDVPTTGTMIVSATADEVDFSNRTFTHTNSGGLKIGDDGSLNKIKHDTTLSFDDWDNAGLTMTANAFTVTGNTLTIKAGCKPIGTITRATNLTITTENDADVSGLILAGSATFTLVGLPASSYSVSSSATTVDVFTRSIVIDTSAVSSTTFFRVLTGTTLGVISQTHTGQLSVFSQGASVTTLESDSDLSGFPSAGTLVFANTAQWVYTSITDNGDDTYTLNGTGQSISQADNATFTVTADNSLSFGSVTGATNSHTINLSSLSISGLTLGDPLVVVVTAADGVDVRHVSTVQNLTDSITINANAAYNSGATTVAGDVAISVDSPITTVTYTLKAGISLGSANTNKTFNSVRSSQNYCDFVAFIGTSGSIVNSSQNATQLDAATNRLATIIDGSTTTAATVQGLILDNGAALSTIFTAATFTGTGSIGLLLTADASVDYPAIGSVVKGVVQDPMIKSSKDIPLSTSDF